ncbi:MAG: hypothetical protein FWH05_05705 [Oscillospiraceae bacterium]|nr:hypothetical protein [Oscillospiraceae bacterium]
MMMKKAWFKVFAVVLAIACFSACTNEGSDEDIPNTRQRQTGQSEIDDNAAYDDSEINFGHYAPALEYQHFDGLRIATTNDYAAMGMARMMEESHLGFYGEPGYQVDIYNDSRALLYAFENDNVKIANLPATLAAELYNKTNGAISVLAINSLGADFFVERLDRHLNYVSDMRKRKVYFTDAFSNTDWVTRYIFAKNHIDIRADIEYIHEADYETIFNLMRDNDMAVAVIPAHIVLPESLKHREDNFVMGMALYSEWANLEHSNELILSQYVSNVTVVKNDYLFENTDDVINFMARYQMSVDFINAPENREKSAELIERHNIMESAEVAARLPFRDIVFFHGNPMKERLKAYYEVMFDFDATSIGSALPGDDFYYLG